MENLNYRNLPTAVVPLDLEFRVLNKTKSSIEREYDEYYLATCHFVYSNGERQYYLEEDMIKELLLMKKDPEPGYPHYIASIKRYGVKK